MRRREKKKKKRGMKKKKKERKGCKADKASPLSIFTAQIN